MSGIHRLRWIGFALLAASVCAGAQEAPGIPEIDIPYQRHVLPNGLTLLIHEDHKAPIAAVNVWYHVGSKNERPGRSGFAHLFEHLMFYGSEHSPKSFFDVIEPAGATDLNGTTNEDRTNYFENVPINALDLALFLESDRMSSFEVLVAIGSRIAARMPSDAATGSAASSQFRESNAARRPRAPKHEIDWSQSAGAAAGPGTLLTRARRT